MSIKSFSPKNGLAVAKARLVESKKMLIKTALKFLLEHNGFRPAAMHLIIGLSGAGKSTFFRTVGIDYQINKEGHDRAGIWYSEESENDFEVHFVKTSMAEAYFLNKDINFYSEVDGWESKKADFAKLEKMFKESDIVFFDNLTTSSFYEGSYNEQVYFLRKLKGLVKKYKKPLVVFAHTDSKAKEGAKALIEQNDIRGPKTICNLSEFVYILQQFHVGSEIKSTLRIVKNRGQEVETKVFFLNYDKKSSTYNDAVKLPFSQFKMFFEQRNKL